MDCFVLWTVLSLNGAFKPAAGTTRPSVDGSLLGGGAWNCWLRVTPPFGADTIVALASAGERNDLLQWLSAHNGRRDAVLVPDLLESVAKAYPTARILFAGVFTNPGRQP